MATFRSKAYIGGVPHRCVSEAPQEITATVEVPTATILGTGDKLYMFKIGANMQILEATLRAEDLDSDGSPTITLDLGYEAAVATDDDNAFISASTIGQSGGSVRVENGGDDAFAVGGLAPIAETIDVFVSPAAAATGATAAARKVTVTMKIAPVTTTPDPNQPPYLYADRYTSAGVSSS